MHYVSRPQNVKNYERAPIKHCSSMTLYIHRYIHATSEINESRVHDHVFYSSIHISHHITNYLTLLGVNPIILKSVFSFKIWERTWGNPGGKLVQTQSINTYLYSRLVTLF